MKTLFSFLVIFISTSICGYAQILYNKTWTLQAGFPDPAIPWSATIASGPFGGPIVVGNTITENEGANVLTTVVDSYGAIVWEAEWNGADSANDYGSSLVLSDDILIVGGATYNELQAAYDYVILAYDITDGTLLWSKIHNGTGNNHDGVTSIAADSTGGIYVTGASVGSGSLSDYLTLKLDIADGSILWQQRYDYNNLHDAPVRILPLDSSVMVTGASANMINDWDYCTVEYDMATGNQLAARRSGSGVYHFDQPTDMIKDDAGNIYVCGKVKNTNGDEDVKLIKMDSDLDVLWERTIDVEGGDDVANAVGLDQAGNVYLTGYYTTTESTKGFIGYKLDGIDGTTVWAKQFPAPWGGDFVGTDLTIWYDVIVYTGYLKGENNSATDMLVYALDTNGNQRVFTTYDFWDAGTINEKGLSIDFIDHQTLIVSGRATNAAGTVTRYLNVRYDYKLRDMEPVVIDSLPAYHSSEMIARFRTNVLNYDFIDNKDLRYAKLEDVIDPGALDMMDSVLDNRCAHWAVTKIFPYLTSSNQTMLNAHGIEVQLPQFYTWLTLSIPKEETIEEVIPILDELGDVFVDVSFNGCIVPFSVPDDFFYSIHQGSLNPIGLVPATIYPYDIDVETAWDYSVGSRILADSDNTNTTVGVFDSGIKQNHEDLEVLAGYDYYYNGGDAIPLDTLNDMAGHGTAMAGIIAARRNNSIGIAGIAGGDWGNNQHGANVVNYKILSNSAGVSIDPTDYYGYMSTAFEAMIDASALGSNPKVNIYNCSWGVNEPTHGSGIPPAQSCYDECALMLTCLAEQGAVVVAASGNDEGNELAILPATTRPSGLIEGFEYTGSPNEFAIVVGGSDERGLHNQESNTGSFVDIIAPSTLSLCYSTNITDGLDYKPINGTSAAAAHVSGVCALLHEYLTNSTDALLNAVSTPVAEDYEKIITNSAFDIIPSTIPEHIDATTGYSEGWDNLSAHGILNARAALEYVDFDHYKIWHFTASDSIISSNLEGNDTLLFTQEYNTVPGMIGRPTGRYVCETYRLTAHPQHDINGETVLDFWPLHSMSNTYDLVYEETPYKRIMQFPQSQVLSCLDTAAYLRAYTFKILHPDGQPGDIINEWYPVNPADARISYSVYSTPTVGIDKLKNDWEFSLFPNPATNQLSLKLPRLNGSYLDITIHDISGKLVQQERNTIESAGNKIKVIDISALSAGVYLCSIRAENKTKTLKFIKQ